MARKKISEFRAKKILYEFLGKKYSGVSIDATKDLNEQVSLLDSSKRYVLKVDQGIKQRKKKGLVFFDVSKENVIGKIDELKSRGFSYFILEEFLHHKDFAEYYLAIERVREGKKVSYSTSGGIDIEENKDKIKSFILDNYEKNKEVARNLKLDVEVLDSILTAFDDYYFSFLEINPLVVHNGEFYFLDTAVEVDSAAEFFAGEKWNKDDFREASIEKTSEEKQIEILKQTSPASFSFEVLNPDGSIFLLLSGGGASLVTADEIYQKGKGSELSNYGEYSGNPNEEETYIYTKNFLTTLLHSKSEKKVIIISGGVANFTDIRITFKGIIRALSEVTDKLRDQNVKVFVRRGGPNQEEGLDLMRQFLEKENLLGSVNGPEMVLTDIVELATDYIS